MAAFPAPLAAITVGDIRLTYLPDGDARFDPIAVFPMTGHEDWRRLHPESLDAEGRMVVSVGGFLMETGDRLVLVDLGVGDRSPTLPQGTFSGGRMLQSLAATGYLPADITDVAYTHLHLDHTGWTSSPDPDGAPRLTFPSARHHVMEIEWEHWQQHAGVSRTWVLEPLATRLEPAHDGAAIAPGLTVLATPGHTPGHCSFVVGSGAERAVIIGDAIHCPAQLTRSDWDAVFDVDAALARRTRERLIRELEDPSTTTADGHFPDQVFGRVLTADGRRRWAPRP